MTDAEIMALYEQGLSLDQACRLTLEELAKWVDAVPASLPPEMRPMAESI